MDQHRGDVPGRRIDDETLEMIQAHIKADEALQGEILKELAAIKKATQNTLEMLQVFNNIKGFWTVAKWVAIITIGAASLAAAVAAIGYIVKQWVRGA